MTARFRCAGILFFIFGSFFAQATIAKEAAKHSKAERGFMSWAEGAKSFKKQMQYVLPHLSEKGIQIFNCFKSFKK